MTVKKPKLVFIINVDWYYNLHWHERVSRLVTLGYEVCVLLPACSEEVKSKLLQANVTLETYKLNRSSLGPFTALASIGSLLSKIRALRPDIIHAVTIKPILYCSFVALLQGIPAVFTFAGMGTLRTSKKFLFRVFRSLVYGSLKLTTRNMRVVGIFENNSDLDFVRREKILNSAKLVRVLGAGVDLDEFSYVPPRVEEMNEFRILFASRLLRDKGLLPLLEAVEFCREVTDRQIQVLVAGMFDHDSPISYTEAEIEAMRLDYGFEWLGNVSDMPNLIARSHIVVLPSSYGEGVPRILIEAASVGRPVVSCDVGGCSDICVNNETGLLIADSTPVVIARALSTILRNPELIITFGKAGRQLVESKFTTDSVLKAHIAVYEEVLAGSKKEGQVV